MKNRTPFIFFFLLCLIPLVASAYSTTDPNPYGVCMNNTTFFHVNYYEDTLDLYSLAGDYQSSISLHADNHVPYDCTTNGTYIWVLDTPVPGEMMVFRYLMNGSYDLNFSVEQYFNSYSYGITNNGTHLFVLDGGVSDTIGIYDMSTNANISSWESACDTGLVATSGRIWCVDRTNDIVRNYTENGTYVSGSYFNLTQTNTDAYSIDTNGVNFYVSDKFCDRLYVYGMDGVYANSYVDLSPTGNPVCASNSPGGWVYFSDPEGSNEDFIPPVGGAGEFLYDWNPDVYPSLSKALSDLINPGTLSSLPQRVWSAFTLTIAFVFKQPASLGYQPEVSSDGI